MLEKKNIRSPPLQSHISPFFIIKELDDVFEKEVSVKTAILYCPGLFGVEDVPTLEKRISVLMMVCNKR